MDARKLLSLVKDATETKMDYYAFAAIIIEAQKEEDALVADALDHADVAAAIRA